MLLNRMVRLAVLIIVTCMARAAFAMPPRNGDYRHKPAGFKPCRTMSSDHARTLMKAGALRAQGKRGIIVPTTKKLIILRVQFSGSPALSVSQAATQQLFDKFQDYYLENSYGKYTVQTTVSNSTYTLSDISMYCHETDSDLRRLITDAKAAADAEIDFSTYDYIMICHAGYGEEEIGGIYSDTYLWSLYYPYTFTADGKNFTGFTIVPEHSPAPNSPLATICHEFGHQLGLPDLYDTSVSGGASTCGIWSLMDWPYGCDGSGYGTGNYPPQLDAWCKNYLQFIDLSARVVQSKIDDALLGDVETSATTGYYKIPVNTSLPTEYFIAEYRSPDPAYVTYGLVGQSIPGAGLLVWHINDAVTAEQMDTNSINNDPTRLGIDLVEADRTATYPPGQAADCFTAGAVFASPLSDSFDGQETGITIAGISVSGSTSRLSIGNYAAAASISLTKAISYPNPAGTGKYHPRTGVLATIVVKATRYPRELDMVIYSLAGEKIRAVTKEGFDLKLSAMADYQWIMEYDWNGKNENNEAVAPGIYLYRITADDEISVGKMAIVR